MAVAARTGPTLSRLCILGDIDAFGVSFLTVLPRLRGVGGLLDCLVLHSCLAWGMESVDCLLHEGPALPHAAVDLLRQNSEALVTKADRFFLPLLRNRRRHRQLVSSVQGDCFSYRADVMFETIEPGVHIVKTPAQQSLD
jgi:hypothetical protein